MSTCRHIAALCLGLVLGLGQPAVGQEPGFVSDASIGPDAALYGLWINTFLTEGDGGPLRRLWETIEMQQEGLSVHEFFFADPQVEPSLPFAIITSQWTSGKFIDPDASKGCFGVIRFAPVIYSNLITGTQRYRHLRGSFAPQFRSFELSASGQELTVSELVLLEVPVNQVRTFPDDAIFATYRRFKENDTAVRDFSWGQVKAEAVWRD